MPEIEQTHVSLPVSAIREHERQLERAQNESEFWYSFARELVVAFVRRRGTDAARRYVERALSFARLDFPDDAITSDAVGMLLDEARRLSFQYAEWGSFKERAEAIAKGQERP